MKSNLNRAGSALALSLCAAFSGAAQAYVQPQEVFLSVYDSANTASYLYDTGLNASVDLGSTSSFTVTLDADPQWQAFLLIAGPNAALNWSVGAYTTQNGVNTKAWWTTTTGDETPYAGTRNVALNTTINNIANGLSYSRIDVQQGVFSEVAGFGAPDYYGPVGGSTLRGNGNPIDMGWAQVFKIANSNTSSQIALVTVTNTGEFANFSNDSGHYVFSMATEVPGVPEPGSWILAVAGLTALAWRSRRYQQ